MFRSCLRTLAVNFVSESSFVAVVCLVGCLVGWLVGWLVDLVWFGLNKMCSFIVIISSTNKYRKHKSSMLISSVTYRQNGNYTDIYDVKMANCCQNVRGFFPIVWAATDCKHPLLCSA